MAKVLDAVSTRYNVRGNSPGHSGTALTKKGVSANPRKSIKVDIIINWNLLAIAYIATNAFIGKLGVDDQDIG